MRHFPLSGDDSRPQLLLKPLELNEWIEFDQDFDFQIAKKAEVLKHHRSTALQILPSTGADEAAVELNQMICDHLAKLGRPAPVVTSPRDGTEAFMQISTWVQEDWALMSSVAPVRLIGGLICFPSRWSLAEKIGLDSNAIHAPVPRFQSVAKPAQNFLERITVDKPMWRINWTIHDSDELFCPGPHPSATDLTSENILERTFLRIERQTFRRLPQTRAIAFSIRTYIHSMTEVLSDASRTDMVKKTLMNLNAETAAYKGMRNFYELLSVAVSSKS